MLQERAYPTKKPLSVSVEDMHNIAEKHRINEGWEEDINTVYTGGFLSGANWQKQQSDSLIKELLRALKENYAISPKGIIAFETTYQKTKLVIEKANNHLKGQS